MNKAENHGRRNVIKMGEEIGFCLKYCIGLKFRTLLTSWFWNFRKLKKTKFFITCETQAIFRAPPGIYTFFFIGNRFSQNRSVRLPIFLAKFGPTVPIWNWRLPILERSMLTIFLWTSIVYFKTLINRLIFVSKKLAITSI